jgi:hypothetical protein
VNFGRLFSKKEKNALNAKKFSPNGKISPNLANLIEALQYGCFPTKIFPSSDALFDRITRPIFFCF